MAPHSSTLAWRIPWTEEPRRLQSTGSLRVGHDWATSLSLFTFMHWRRKWQPTPVFLPGESQGRGAWWAAVYGVAQSRTWLKRLSSSSSISCSLSSSCGVGSSSTAARVAAVHTFRSHHIPASHAVLSVLGVLAGAAQYWGFVCNTVGMCLVPGVSTLFHSLKPLPWLPVAFRLKTKPRQCPIIKLTDVKQWPFY